MALNLGNLGQIGSGFGGALPNAQNQWIEVALQQLRLKEAQQQAQQQQRQRTAQGLIANMLSAQQGGGQPQPPMPGQPSLPMTPAGGGLTNPGGAAAGPAMAAPQSMAPQPMGPAYGTMTIQQMASRLKAANPSIDDNTLFDALVQYQQFIQPEQRAELQAVKMQSDFQTKMLTLEERAREADARNATAEERAQIAQQAADMKLELARMHEQGMRDRQSSEDAAKLDRIEKSLAGRKDIERGRETATMARLKYAQDKIDARASAARGNKAQVQAAATEYKGLAAQVAKATTDLTQALQGTDNDAISAAFAKKSALQEKIIRFWQDKGKALGLPSPSELVSGGGQAAASPGVNGGQPSAPPPDAAPVASGAMGTDVNLGVPPGAPTATSADGKKVYWDGQAWRPAPAAR